MADSGIEFLVKKSEGQWHIQGDMSVIKKYDLHHTVIPPWIYRIPSELRSQAGLGLPSTVVGDHTGIVSVVCFFVPKVSSSVFRQTDKKVSRLSTVENLLEKTYWMF